MESKESASDDSKREANVAELADRLLAKLKLVPHHAISLRRNKYRVIRRIARELGWDLVQDKDASILWLDKWETSDMTNLRYSKVGHFLGMRDVASKCSLGRTMNRMKAAFPVDYDFHPVTFILPTDKDKLLEYAAAYTTACGTGSKASNAMSTLLAGGVGGSGTPAYLTKQKKKSSSSSASTDSLGPPSHGCWSVPGGQAQPQPSAGDRLVFIVKPDASSRGNGIYLALTLSDIKELEDDEEKKAPARKLSAATDTDSDAEAEELKKLTLVQTYLPRPLLMNERKFDLRIYVLVTGAYPTLRVYIYRQGLVRFATEDYSPPNESNVRARKMFLTNYAVNKATEAAGIAGLPDDFPDDESEASDAPDALEEADPAAAAASAKTTVKKKKTGRKEAPLPPRAKQQELLAAREGCKWSLQALLDCMQAQGIDTDVLWCRIKDIIAKTMLAIRASMAQKYRAARPQLRKEAPPPEPVKKRPARAIPRSLSSSRRTAPLAREPAPVAVADEPSESSSTSKDAVAMEEAAAASPTLRRRPHSASPPNPRKTASNDAGISDWRNNTHFGKDAGFNPLQDLAQIGGRPAAGGIPTGTARRAPITTPATNQQAAQQSLGPMLGIMGTAMSISAPKVAAKAPPQRTIAPRPAGKPSLDMGICGVGSAFSTRVVPLEAPAISRPALIHTPKSDVHTPDSLGEKKTAEAPQTTTPSLSRPPKKAPETAAADEEDGEQGFRGFELMGLDVILDMSHCTCANRDKHQRVVSNPATPCDPALLHRCQPRPVLLEINQSCSLHSDSDLDRVIKGDVVRDAFTMVAPDESWLLDRFKEVLQMRMDDTLQPYDAAADQERLSKAQFNSIVNTSSFDAIPEAHENAQHFAAVAAQEAAAIMKEYVNVTLPTTTPTTAVKDGVKDKDSVSPETPGLKPTNLGLVAYIPPPARPLSLTIPSGWKDEMWFGQGVLESSSSASLSSNTAVKSAPPTPTSRDGNSINWAAFSLACIPPLSKRAQLVLFLRRIYEHLHMGGFQRLSPPTTPELVERYRRIAEYVPPQLRETAAFVRRRQEALAIRAALESKKPTR